MATANDVSADELVQRAAEEMKKIKEIQPAEWASFAKTGVHKERPPVSKDWWYFRAASILKTIYKLGSIGISKLRTKYSGRKNRGHKPEHTYKGSGSVARKIVQQLDKAGLTKQVEKGKHKGRIITPKGKSIMDKIATQIMAGKPKIIKPSKIEVLKEKAEKAPAKHDKHKAVANKEKTPEAQAAEAMQEE